MSTSATRRQISQKAPLLTSRRTDSVRRLSSLAGHGVLFLVASSSAFLVLFIFCFIAYYALPFFNSGHLAEFFTSSKWYPTMDPPEFGALAIFFGSAVVTVGATIVAVPLGIVAAVCLSDILPFTLRQVIKPVIELLAAIPSVAYGFFALVVLAPLLQEKGGPMLALMSWVGGAPIIVLGAFILSDLTAGRFDGPYRIVARIGFLLLFGAIGFAGVHYIASDLAEIHISTGRNVLNVSLILGIMALPTVVSVSEDALQAVGRELREGSYALGATRAETMLRVVIPAAGSGICAAIILGIMRAVGETMVVWMAAGNSPNIPEPWYNVLEPVRTLTATIAGEMGEADHSVDSNHYSVLFLMALCLLTVSYVFNMLSDWIAQRSVKARRG